MKVTATKARKNDPMTGVITAIRGMDENQFRDLLTFMRDDGVKAVQRLVADRAAKDALFRDVLVSAERDQAQFREFEARSYQSCEAFEYGD